MWSRVANRSLDLTVATSFELMLNICLTMCAASAEDLAWSQLSFTGMEDGALRASGLHDL